MTITSRGRRGGLTLLEVVFAVGVLSIILLGVFSAMNTAQRADALTRERRSASEVAFAMMDTLLSGEAPPVVSGVVTPEWTPFAVPHNGSTLKPADPYPMEPFGGVAGAPEPPTVGGIPVAGLALTSVPDVANMNLIEVRVVVAWRPSDWTRVGDPDQRIELVSRRIR
jgi:type II secretory pathway pseudopilin PulG